MELRPPKGKGWSIGTKTVHVAASSADRQKLLESARLHVSTVSDNSVAVSKNVLMHRTFNGNESYYWALIDGPTAIVTAIYGSLVNDRKATMIVWDFKGACVGERKYGSMTKPRLNPAPARLKNRGLYKPATKDQRERIFAHIGRTEECVGMERDEVDVAEEEEEEELLQEEEEELAAEMEFMEFWLQEEEEEEEELLEADMEDDMFD